MEWFNETWVLYCFEYFTVSSPLPSPRQHQSYGNCLEVKREYYQNSYVLDCVTQCSQSTAHLVSSSYRSNRLGLSHWDPYAVRRGGCLELYYCNIVEWFWRDSSWISTTNWFPSVLWHCWFGHRACKNRPRMTCNVSSGTLNPTHSHSLLFPLWKTCLCWQSLCHRCR